jgi:hypothetical protein
LLADLDLIANNSKIKYDPNLIAVSRTRDNNSIYFSPRTADERDDFVDLLFMELTLRGLSVEGDLEELREQLLSEVILENKYRANLQKLAHCSALEACIIALLPATQDSTLVPRLARMVLDLSNKPSLSDPAIVRIYVCPAAAYIGLPCRILVDQHSTCVDRCT